MHLMVGSSQRAVKHDLFLAVQADRKVRRLAASVDNARIEALGLDGTNVGK
jgi:hypothetical protein